ncbi:connector protein [Curtobacterium phage Ayka]|nr:connector protein [Curtobacterium phage Ayka]
MSKRHKPSDIDAIYDNHLNAGQKFRTNPAEDRTAVIERMYWRILSELCINRFKWSGLDDTGVNVRFMELTLFQYGLACVFKHSATGKVVAVRATPTGQWDYAMEPIAYTVQGANMRTKRLARRFVVPVWPNAMRTTDLDIVAVYAKRLAELDRSIEIAADNARRTMVAFVSENERLSMDNIIRQIREGQPVIRVNSDAYTPGELQQKLAAVNFGSDPDGIEKLHIIRTRMWGECMGLLGFDFANQDKKERVVASEVDANNSQVDAMRFVNLNARRVAAKEISKKFDLDVKVEYHITSETSNAMIPEQPAVGAAA